MTYLLYILLALTSFFLICLVLIQRGKGGGLAGAFGGVGGSSAFGTKAGDVFTRVTMITAGIWITLNMLLVVITNNRPSAFGPTPTTTGSSALGTSKTPADKTGTPVESTEGGTGKPAVIPEKGSDAGPLAPRSADLPGTPVPVAPPTGTTPPPTKP